MYTSREHRLAYARDHYRKNKAIYLARNNKRKKQLAKYLQDYKNRPCSDCGESFPYYVMDFDHREGTQKLYEPNKLASRGGKFVLENELAKCDVVCSNCHRIRTHQRRIKRDLQSPTERLTH